MMNRFGVPEDTIVATFGKFIAVLQVRAGRLFGGEHHRVADQAHGQQRVGVARRRDGPLKASYFANKDETPSEDVVKEQFER